MSRLGTLLRWCASQSMVRLLLFRIDLPFGLHLRLHLACCRICQLRIPFEEMETDVDQSEDSFEKIEQRVCHVFRATSNSGVLLIGSRMSTAERFAALPCVKNHGVAVKLLDWFGTAQSEHPGDHIELLAARHWAQPHLFRHVEMRAVVDSRTILPSVLASPT